MAAGTHDGKTTDERIAVAETNIGALEKAILATNDNVKSVTDAVSIISRDLAEVTVLLRNPSKEHCILFDDFKEFRQLYLGDIKSIREAHTRDLESLRESHSADKKTLYAKIDAQEAEISTLKSRADKFEGGTKVIIALIGGGNLLTIIAILGGLVWLSNHMGK